MEIKNILVVVRASEEQLEWLQLAAPEARVVRQSVKTLEPWQVEEADVVVGNIPEKFFPYMKQVKLLQLNSSGVPQAYLDLARTQPDMVLCSASGAYGPAISEHLVGALLMMMKRLHQYRDDQPNAAWIDRGDVRSIRDSKVLVLGMGDIGTLFARLVHAFGAEVVGIRRREAKAPEGVSRIATMEELDSLLPWADVVAMSLPETRHTIGLMNARRLQLMKPGSYLLNVGRGTAVDQDALVAALRSGHLAGAHLDVTDPEPLPADHPLWKEENAFITPHISGQFHLPLTLDLIHKMAAHNIRALKDRTPYVARVDVESGYRA